MSAIDAIKNELKKYDQLVKAVRFGRSARRTVMVKLGLAPERKPIYGSFRDKESRLFLSETLKEKLKMFEPDRPLKVLMLGSPGLHELQDVPVETLGRFEVTGVDIGQPIEIKLPVKSYEYVRMNIFDYYKQAPADSYDLILNRWFFHHISENNKKNVCAWSEKLLKDKGVFIVIDWFIDEWDTPEELKEAQIKYFEYRVKYLPHLKSRIEPLRNIDADELWNSYHRDDDWAGGKFPSREKVLSYMKEAGFANVEAHDVADRKIIDNPFLWGNTLIHAEKEPS